MFILAITIITAYIAFTSIDTAFSKDNNINTTLGYTDFTEQAAAFPKYMDFTFLTVLIAIVIAVMILGWVVASNPALFFIYVVLIAILGAYAGYLSNAFSDALANSDAISTAAASFPIMSFVMNNYMVFVVVMVFLMMIVFFAKPNVGGGY